MTNIIFIKGTKQSIVDFINRGLKGCKSKVRISAAMFGGQIADRLNGHGCPITMHSYLPVEESKITPLDLWKFKCETKEELCLMFQLIDAQDHPTAFLRYINDMDGITVYAYGFDSPFYSTWYQYNGRKDEEVRKVVAEDPKTADADASYKVLEGFLQDFLKELDLC